MGPRTGQGLFILFYVLTILFTYYYVSTSTNYNTAKCKNMLVCILKTSAKHVVWR